MKTYKPRVMSTQPAISTADARGALQHFDPHLAQTHALQLYVVACDKLGGWHQIHLMDLFDRAKRAFLEEKNRQANNQGCWNKLARMFGGKRVVLTPEEEQQIHRRLQDSLIGACDNEFLIAESCGWTNDDYYFHLTDKGAQKFAQPVDWPS